MYSPYWAKKDPRWQRLKSFLSKGRNPPMEPAESTESEIGLDAVLW